MIEFKRRTVILIGSALLLQAEPGIVLFRPLPANSLDLYVEKTGFLSGKKHHFVFTEYEGRADMEKSVEFTIRSASISCRDKWVKDSDIPKIEQVARKDMLAIDKYPSIRFQSTSIQALEEGKYRVSGMLQIRDMRKPVDVVVQRSGSEYTGSAKFRLTDFGLKPPSAALGLVGTKNEVEFQFKVFGDSE
jgi:polyisoprenoid-binding protein YceI